MGDKESKIKDRKSQVTATLSEHELTRFHAYLERTGLKKGFFIRQAILEKLARDEERLRKGECA